MISVYYDLDVQAESCPPRRVCLLTRDEDSPLVIDGPPLEHEPFEEPGNDNDSYSDVHNGVEGWPRRGLQHIGHNGLEGR